MYQRDYILLLIEQFGLVLRKIFFHVENKEYDQALNEIDNAYKELLGVDGHIVRGMSEEQINQYMKIAGNTKFEKSLVMAEFLKIEAEIEEAVHGELTDYALDKYLISFDLLIDAFINRKELIMERFLSDADDIVKKTLEYFDSDELKYKLFHYYEFRGRFAKAEDVLFELIDDNYPGVLQAGRSFYNRLLLMPDEELISGNLPREEVLDSLATIESRIS
jgi:hypothetical protein